MNITLVGMGSGQPQCLTEQGLAALKSAELIIGARRLLLSLPDGCTQNRVSAYQIEEVIALLHAADCEKATLVYSGDTGFYSGASALIERLRAEGQKVTVCPGISSVQLLSAALGRPWQGWNLVSAHGRACNVLAECCQGRPTFFLTGGTETPDSICAKLTDAGLGEARAIVGQSLGTPQQKIVAGAAAQLAEQRFESLSVLLIEEVPASHRRCSGLPDDAFLRGKTPMTKQEVRAAVLAKMAVTSDQILWDVGAGTGSVSVELALAAPRGHVYAVERDAEACALVRANRERFHTYNLTLVEGLAPQALSDLPAPDAVFIGGSGGRLEAIVDSILQKNPAARVCVTAVALETLSAAVAVLTARGMTVEVTQIAVSRTRAAGGLHMLMANNPIFIIMGGWDASASGGGAEFGQR